MGSRWLLRLTCALLLGSTIPLPAGAIEARVLKVAPGATGDCITAACGSLQEAYAAAWSGGIIEMAAGTYAEQIVDRQDVAASWTANVTVRPASGAKVTVSGVGLRSPRITMRGITFDGSVRLGPGADWSRLEDVTINGASYVTGSRNTAIVGSRLRPGRDQDALQIKPPRSGAAPPENVLIAGNDFGPALLTPGSKHHADGIQVMGVSGLVVRGNRISEAASQTILLKPDLNSIDDVLVEGNLIFECAPRREECPGYYALQVRGSSGVRDVTVRHNTIMGGTIADDVAGLRVSRNVITERGTGSPAYVENLVAPGSSGYGTTNVVGVPEFSGNGMTLASSSPGYGWGLLAVVPRSTGVTASPGPESPSGDAEAPTGGAVQQGTFIDVPTEGVHHTAIELLAERGISTGCAPERYCPEQQTTRAQMATLLARVLELPSGEESFSDVTAGHPHLSSVGALAAAGYIEGCEAERFCPSEAITRGQMASILQRALGLPDAPAPFPDVAGVHGGAIGALAEAGVVDGGADGQFRPNDRLTRAQAATIIVRALG